MNHPWIDKIFLFFTCSGHYLPGDFCRVKGKSRKKDNANGGLRGGDTLPSYRAVYPQGVHRLALPFRSHL